MKRKERREVREGKWNGWIDGWMQEERERESTEYRKVGIGKGKKGRDRGQREGMELERRTKQF